MSCIDVGCEIIETLEQCSNASAAHGLPPIEESHISAGETLAPGCFYNTSSNTMEYQINPLPYNGPAPDHWDSLCYCPGKHKRLNDSKMDKLKSK